MTLAFIIFGLLTLAVYLDDRLEKKKPVLGEEWDFTKISSSIKKK